MIPVPGAKQERWVTENAAAAELRLTGEDLAEIASLPPAQGRGTEVLARFGPGEAGTWEARAVYDRQNPPRRRDEIVQRRAVPAVLAAAALLLTAGCSSDDGAPPEKDAAASSAAPRPRPPRPGRRRRPRPRRAR